MTEYIKGIIIFTVSVMLCLSVLPKNASQTGRHVKQLAAFMLLAVMLAPLQNVKTFISSLTEAFQSYASGEVNSDDESDGSLADSCQAQIGKSAEMISRYVIGVCAERFGMDEEKIKVKLIIDESEIESVKIEEIQVFAEESDFDVLEEARAYLESEFCTRVYVFGE